MACAGYLRLRQVCLAAPALAPAVAALQAVLDLEVCHRDPALAAFGLENALFCCGEAFLEIVAPLRPDTAVERFLARSGGQGGYMAIFDCDDPDARRAHLQALGVRVALPMAQPGFRGTQFHPRDCRATMLEFDHSDGGDALDGAYWPAGPHWPAHRRPECVAGLPLIELRSPDAAGLAAHWSRLMQRPLTQDADGHAMLAFELGAARFVGTAPGTPELLHTLALAVPAPAATLRAAAARGLPVEQGAFALAGMWLRPVAAGPVTAGPVTAHPATA